MSEDKIIKIEKIEKLEDLEGNPISSKDRAGMAVRAYTYADGMHAFIAEDGSQTNGIVGVNGNFVSFDSMIQAVVRTSLDSCISAGDKITVVDGLFVKADKDSHVVAVAMQDSKLNCDYVVILAQSLKENIRLFYD